MMRFAVFSSLLLLLSFRVQAQQATRARPEAPSAAPDASASIEGFVLDSANGKPLAGVHVRLVKFYAGEPPTLLYGALSNEAGRFSINTIEPGTYLLALEKASFVLVLNGEKTKNSQLPTLELKAGQRLTNVKLAMTRQAVIAGHVYDEYGEPVAGAQVSAISAKSKLGPRGVTVTSGFASTDDRGEFRVAVRPGAYYIKAQARPALENQAEIRTDGTEDANYLETYYPETADGESATPVETHSGAELEGVAIRLARSVILRINGTVSGVPEDAKFLQVTLRSRFKYSPIPIIAVRDSEGKLDNKFVFGHLGAGAYELYARCTVGDEKLESPVVELTLTESNVENINLTLTSGLVLTGVMEQASAANTRHQRSQVRSIKLQPIGSILYSDVRSSVGEVAADGTFQLKGVQPGSYRLILDPRPENSFIKMLQLNGTEMSPDNFEVTSEGVMKITVSGSGGQLFGKVQDKDGKSLHAWGMVFLVPDKKIGAMDEVHSMMIAADGNYSFHGLRPGHYRLFAIGNFGQSFWGLPDGVDQMNQYAATAEAVDIKEGDKITKDVKLYSEEDENATRK